MANRWGIYKVACPNYGSATCIHTSSHIRIIEYCPYSSVLGEKCPFTSKQLPLICEILRVRVRVSGALEGIREGIRCEGEH